MMRAYLLLMPVLLVMAGVLGGQEPGLRLEEIGSIGVLDASENPNAEFGNIGGVDFDPEQEIIVLFDQHAFRLSAFSLDGRFLGAGGRQGQGPGEFRGFARPIVSGSDVYVPDASNGRVSRWSVTPGGLVHDGGFRTEIPVERSACALGDHLIVSRYRGGKALHRMSPDGRVTFSFGDHPLAGDNEGGSFDVQFIQPGSTLCSGSDHRVYQVSVFGGIRAFSAETGELLWQRDIPGLVPPRIVTRGGTNIPQFLPAEGRRTFMAVVSVTFTPRGQILLQFGDKPSMESVNDILDVTSALVDPGTGELLAIRDDLPRIDHSGGGFAFSKGNDPFPRVKIYRWVEG